MVQKAVGSIPIIHPKSIRGIARLDWMKDSDRQKVRILYYGICGVIGNIPACHAGVSGFESR